MLQNRATHHSKKNLVSVIIPTYNRCSLLKEAIYSVYSQTYRPIQCIIVDDGSADETFAFVNSILSLNNEDFILQYLYQNNSGSQVARNAGTNVANGEYIQYLDSDDLLYPTKLATQVSYLNDHPECDAVFGDWDSGTKSSNNLIVGYASKDMIKQFLTLERNIANFSILMRRELVSHIGLWDVSIKRFQEIDFHLRGLMIGAIYHYQSLNTGLWRYHESPRIHNRAGLDAMCYFFKKWQVILTENKKFSIEIAEKIADWYMWFLSSSKHQNPNNLLEVLSHVVSLKPSINFYNSFKMRVLRLLFGQTIALKIWLMYFTKKI